MSDDKKDSKSKAPAGNWTFDSTSDGEVSSLTSVTAPIKNFKPVKWTSSDYMHKDKSFKWYLYLLIVVVALAAVIYLLTKDKITTGVVIFCGIIFGVYGARRTSDIDYLVDETGITVGQRPHPFSTFKSFSLVDEGRFMSLLFVPTKRFLPMLTVTFDPKDEKRIVEALDNRLPLDNRGQDVLERFLRRIGY